MPYILPSPASLTCKYICDEGSENYCRLQSNRLVIPEVISLPNSSLISGVCVHSRYCTNITPTQSCPGRKFRHSAHTCPSIQTVFVQALGMKSEQDWCVQTIEEWDMSSFVWHLQTYTDKRITKIGVLARSYSKISKLRENQSLTHCRGAAGVKTLVIKILDISVIKLNLIRSFDTKPYPGMHKSRVDGTNKRKKYSCFAEVTWRLL